MKNIDRFGLKKKHIRRQEKSGSIKPTVWWCYDSISIQAVSAARTAVRYQKIYGTDKHYNILMSLFSQFQVYQVSPSFSGMCCPFAFGNDGAGRCGLQFTFLRPWKIESGKVCVEVLEVVCRGVCHQRSHIHLARVFDVILEKIVGIHRHSVSSYQVDVIPFQHRRHSSLTVIELRSGGRLQLIVHVCHETYVHAVARYGPVCYIRRIVYELLHHSDAGEELLFPEILRA